MTDSACLNRIISTIQPDEIYNLAAQSHVAVSFESPEYTANSDALGVLRLLEIIRQLNQNIKFYQASSSEMFGSTPPPQDENSVFSPQSPYGTSKLFGYWITRNYRDAYGIFASNGIMFNHESPFRGETFVTRKITRALVAISLGSSQVLTLGNINSIRDWGHAREYTELMWRILQLDRPTDLVIATGRSYSVKYFVNMTANLLGIKLVWEGEGVNEVAKNNQGRVIVKIDPGYYRPLEVEHLRGNASLARSILNWSPSITLEELISEMVVHDKMIIMSKKHE